LDFEANLGAYPTMIVSGSMTTLVFTGPYKIPKLAFRARAYYSNTCGLGAYRGPWMMESLVRETMMDEAAREIGIDPVELRRRNLIRQEDQPHTMPTGLVVDRVTPLEAMERVLKNADVPAFRAEQAEARKQGRYLGLGFAVYLEPTTMAFGGVLSSEVAQVRVEPTGKVFAEMSTLSQGHGTQTTMAQVIADELGVDVADVTILEGDSTRGGYGAGAGGSRQAVAGGGAAKQAAAQVRAKIKKIAGHLLNANPDHIEIDNGVISVTGVSEVTTTVKRVAEIAYLDIDRMPAGMELGLEFQSRYRPPYPIVWSNASHVCICEVDIDTGTVKILRWLVVEDCGVMINPAIVEGQVAGGIAQAIGGVLFEHASYDAAGNPLAVTFKDYLLPSVRDVPTIEFDHLCTPSDSLGGFKGVGEGGAIIGPPTLVNAIADALSPFGVSCLDLPLSPPRILALLETSRKNTL
jgi:carbon-monoxide dehydrogenase large subunit